MSDMTVSCVSALTIATTSMKALCHSSELRVKFDGSQRKGGTGRMISYVIGDVPVASFGEGVEVVLIW